MKKLIIISVFAVSVLLSISACKKQSDRPDDTPMEMKVNMMIGLDNELAVEIFDYYSGQAVFSETLIGKDEKTVEGHPTGTQQIFSLNLEPSVSMLTLSYRLKRNTLAQGWGGWVEVKINGRTYINEQVEGTSKQTREIDLSKPLYEHN